MEVETLVKLIPNSVGAVFTCVGDIVDEIPRAAVGEEIAHILTTLHTCWRGESVELHGSADDRLVVELGDNHAADKASEGIQLVEPCAPEFGDLSLGDRNTTEEGEGDDDERVQ